MVKSVETPRVFVSHLDDVKIELNFNETYAFMSNWTWVICKNSNLKSLNTSEFGICFACIKKPSAVDPLTITELQWY